MPGRSEYVAIDCEMVGTTAKNGSSSSVLARVVLIDWKGRTILDTYVKSPTPVTDYRTFVSGITASDLVNAPYFPSVRARVQAAISGKILVGHGLENDLAALQMHHPWWMQRDTAYYAPYMRKVTSSVTGTSAQVPNKLKDLCRSRLNREIQLPGQAHCPKEDAQAALDLYKSHRPRWEACLATQVQKVVIWERQQQQQLLRQQQQLRLQQQQHSYYNHFSQMVR
jgi:RNA exonuclease 4